MSEFSQSGVSPSGGGGSGGSVTVTNFPAVQTITGSVGLNPTPVITANTSTTGSAGLAVGNAPYQPLFVSVTSSLPVTIGSLPQLQVSNFPATQNVSGSVTVGTWGNNVTGSVVVTTTGSAGLLVSFGATTPAVSTTLSGSSANTTFMNNQSSFWSTSSVGLNFSGAPFDTAAASVITFTWNINQGSTANTLTGSIALQHSADASTWNDLPNPMNFMQARWPIAVSAAANGSLSGTLQAIAPCRYVRPQINYVAGSGCSLTASITTRG